MSFNHNDIIEILSNFLYTWLLSVFGAISNYLYVLSKWKAFKWSTLIINVILWFYVWNVIGSFIPEWYEYRDWVLLIWWFIVWNVLEIIEKKWPEIIKKIFNTNNNNNDKKRKN